VDRCLADFDRALQVEPGRVDVLAARADARLQKGDFAGAVADLDAAIARDPKNAALYVSRAGMREAAKKNDDAIADYSAAIQLDPTLSTAFFRRAALFEAADNRSRAVADLQKVIALNADSNSVRAAQARLSRLGANRPVPAPASTLVFLQYLDPADNAVLKKLAAALESGGFKVAGVQLVKDGRTTGDVRALPQDARAAASIEMLAESALADAGYDVPLGRITLQTPGAKPGRVEVWIPPLSLPAPRSPTPSLRK